MARKQTKKKSAKSKIRKLRHRRFCELYALDMEYMGNATRAYANAFKIDLTEPEVYKKSYNACKSNANELLTKTYILAYINELLDELVLNDTAVDQQLAYVIHQHSDLKAKISGIKEYNQLRARIKDKLADSVDNFAEALHKANTKK